MKTTCKPTQAPASAEGWLQDLIDFEGWFSEKGTQVEPSRLVAFGIPLESRYGKAFEIHAMLSFAEHAARAGVASYITDVFYDSKACICSYCLTEDADYQPAILAVIHQCALATLPQFLDPDGDIHHGPAVTYPVNGDGTEESRPC